MPEPDPSMPRRGRPGYLVAALLVLCAVGMVEVIEGSGAIRIVNDPLGATAAMSRGGEEGGTALISAIGLHAGVTLPIGLAEVMLGGLLVIIAVRGLAGRRIDTSFALQVLLANGALLVTGWVLEAPVRASLLDTLVRTTTELPPGFASKRELEAALRLELTWGPRGMLGIELFALALAAVAMTRRRAKESLMAPPEPTPEE